MVDAVRTNAEPIDLERSHSAAIRGMPRNLLVLLALGLALRLCTVPILGLHHPDELWQYLEPAHKLVFGEWVRAWEFRAGIRTWLIPILISPAMWLGDILSPSGLLHVYLARALMALLSLTVVWSSWQFGERISRTHAFVAAFVAATWVELVHFGAKTMSESLAVTLVFPAAVLLSDKRVGRRGLILAGILLGLAFAVRFQLAPALGVLVLGSLWKRWRALGWVVAGSLLGLAVDGLADLMAGAVPFRWIVENFRINLIEGKSAQYGQAPFYAYPIMMLRWWSAPAGAILIFAGFGARRFPVLLLVAVVNIVAHSFIPHKEYRFILLSSALIVFLAAIGTAETLQLARSQSRKWTAAICATWLAASAYVAVIPPMRAAWRDNGGILKALRIASTTPQICGLATYQLKEPLLAVAYTFYHRDTPMFAFKGNQAALAFQSHRDRFNSVITDPEHISELGPDYHLVGCSTPTWQGPLCVSRRRGACSSSPAPEFEVNHLLEVYGR